MTVKQKKIASVFAIARILLPITLSEIDFMYSIKESASKDGKIKKQVKYIFCSGKFSEEEQGEIWNAVISKIIRTLAIILAIFP